MANPGRLSPVALARRFFAPLALALLVVSPFAVNAQDNANGANSNNVNQNVNTNRNANANAGANANANTNTNNNRNGNTNANAGRNGNDNKNDNRSDDNANAAMRAEERRDTLVKSGWYYFLISLLFGVLLVPFAMVIYRAIRFSKGTFGPLGMPEGSLRAILAFMLVSFVGFFVLASVLSFSEFNPPQFLLGIVATVVGFYFGTRSNEGRGNAPAQSGTVGGTVKDKAGVNAVGATVELTQADGNKLSAKTGANGEYKIEKVPAGDHDIEATPAKGSPDQPSGKVNVTVKAGETSAKDLSLK